MAKKIILLILIIHFISCKNSFIVRNVEVSGLNYANKNNIMKIVNSLKNKNLFMISMNKLVKSIKKDEFIKDVQILKIPPNTLQITVLEYNILGYYTGKKNFLILENGHFVPYPKRVGIEIRISDSIPLDNNLSEYLIFVNKHKELLKNTKTLYIGENYIKLTQQDGFILKIDKKLQGLKYLKYTTFIKRNVKEKIKGLDLRFNNMAILITEG